MTMKKLCRIRLINWHYFVDETIRVNGSFLITGENTSGKSTILDAIQLVLTTNNRRFNTAANEKSSRDLKGYVRCKTGNEDSTYLRKGTVITYAALEFYEEKNARYFTVGVKIDSPDEETRLTIKWFKEEGRLEDLTFLTGNKPSVDDEFRKNGVKVRTIASAADAREIFGRRFGNLDPRFFDMIPKSLAFKPMDNVKDFINKFILAEKNIEVATLRKNIEVLKELEDMMATTKEKISRLEAILAKSEEISAKEREIRTNEILMKKAEIEAAKENVQALAKAKSGYEQALRKESETLEGLQLSYNAENLRYGNLQAAISQNEMTKLISDTRHHIDILQRDKTDADDKTRKLAAILIRIEDTLRFVSKNDPAQALLKPSIDDVRMLGRTGQDTGTKSGVLFDLKTGIDSKSRYYDASFHQLHTAEDELTKQKAHLEQEIHDLQNKKLRYPDTTLWLIDAIKEEFARLGIQDTPRILSDLLEVTDPAWQNAVEGYLNSQRFYVIVEPKYYDKALDVYNRVKRRVHTVGLVNTGKLDSDAQPGTDSLAYVVKSDNRWARAYITYLLGRVTRCNDVHQLKEYKVAMTADCMLYQNFAVRKISDEIYKTPFIGAYAYETQLRNKQAELLLLDKQITETKASFRLVKDIADRLRECHTYIVEENMEAPDQVARLGDQIRQESIKLRAAESDPSYIEKMAQLETSDKLRGQIQGQIGEASMRIGALKQQIAESGNKTKELEDSTAQLEESFEDLCRQDTAATQAGLRKFETEIRQKTPAVILSNFHQQRVTLSNHMGAMKGQIFTLQSDYCITYDSDFGRGFEYIQDYRNEHHKLVTSDIIKYEDELAKAKDNCHKEFRESFLAKLKENIDDARTEFGHLNKALRGIYYGEDSYKFEIMNNKSKESICRMINSRNNEAGVNLWTADFEAEFKVELEDLFGKLTAFDDKGEKVLAEYTDYRSYLDYDIKVEQKNGSSQLFSKIYGEKSGGETQTPYYVAIAASFVQLYKHGDTIRIILFDEAFDKMDDNRIDSMMDFLRGQNLQMIIATPPAKMEIIGEKVDTILMAIREGTQSSIEEFNL
ncbi:MAG: ATP-binding protein [Saccharofermentanales bacterium]